MAKKVDLSSLPLPKPKRKPRGKPYEPGNKFAVKRGEVRNPKGISGPTSLSAAYTRWLRALPPEKLRLDAKKKMGFEPMTWAELIGASLSFEAANGDVSAAKEIRQATEGDLIETHGTEESTLRVTGIDYRLAVAPLAPGPMDDSSASGEGEGSGDG